MQQDSSTPTPPRTREEMAELDRALRSHIEAGTPPDNEVCERCGDAKPYNGDWYAGLCPECADETEHSAGNED